MPTEDSYEREYRERRERRERELRERAAMTSADGTVSKEKHVELSEKEKELEQIKVGL